VTTAALLAPGLIARWAKLYSDNKALSSVVTFVHLGGILLGGGMAVATDRASLRMAPAGSPDRPRQLAEASAIHNLVLAGLAITFASGLAMFLSDLDTYLTSVVFWTKMSLVTILLANGYVRLRAERRLVAGDATADAMFRRTSVASLVLWFTILLAGSLLMSD